MGTVVRFAAVVLLLLGGCNGPTRRSVALEGPEWRLTELGGDAPALGSGARVPSLRLDGERRQATGYGGCNNFFGGYQLDNERLSFGPIGSTRMACGQPQDELEFKLIHALDATRSFTIQGTTLSLREGDRVLARFVTD